MGYGNNRSDASRITGYRCLPAAALRSRAATPHGDRSGSSSRGSRSKRATAVNRAATCCHRRSLYDILSAFILKWLRQEKDCASQGRRARASLAMQSGRAHCPPRHYLSHSRWAKHLRGREGGRRKEDNGRWPHGRRRDCNAHHKQLQNYYLKGETGQHQEAASSGEHGYAARTPHSFLSRSHA